MDLTRERKIMSHLPIPDLTPLFKMLGWALAVTIPLALWKLVDIAIWLWRHVDFNWVS